MKHVKSVSKLYPSKPAVAAVVIGEKASKEEKKEPATMAS